MVAVISTGFLSEATHPFRRVGPKLRDVAPIASDTWDLSIGGEIEVGWNAGVHSSQTRVKEVGVIVKYCNSH